MFAHVHEQGQLPGWVKLPASVAIPFGAFEAALQDETNADVSVDFVKLAGFGGAPQEDLSNLEAVRNAVRRLRPPEGFREKLQRAFSEEGVRIQASASRIQGLQGIFEAEWRGCHTGAARRTCSIRTGNV